MSGEPPLGYAQLMAELRRLCAERRSGTLFIATASNQSGRIGLRDGNIVSMRFQLRKGLDAVGEISKVSSARCTFTDHAAEEADPRAPLPPTRDVLRLLTGTDTGAPPPSGQLSDTDLLRAQNVLAPALAEFLGPMATLIVREQLLDASRHGYDIRKAIEAIAKQIEDPAKAALFKQQVLARLVDRPAS